MDDSMKNTLLLGGATVAGGWGGSWAIGRLGAALGLNLGMWGSVAGAVIGGMLGYTLANNQLGEAATQMNVRRADLALPDLGPFATQAEGYTALKTERAAELWLEARRMGDVRSWLENNIPGDYIDGNYRDGNQVNQYPNKVEDLLSRDRAYWVGRNEVEANPNVNVADLLSCSPGG